MKTLNPESEPWYIQNPRHIQNTVWHLRWNFLQKQLHEALFKLKLAKQKKFLYFLIFRETNFLALILKSFLFCLKIKLFQETELSYTSGSNFPSPKMKKTTVKKCLIFVELEISGLNLKKLKSPACLKITKSFKTNSERRRISQSSYENIFAAVYF